MGERCQLVESSRDTKERELTDMAEKVPLVEVAVDEKEWDQQKALLERAGLERLLGLVINREGRLNPHHLIGICDQVRMDYQYMRTLFYL